MLLILVTLTDWPLLKMNFMQSLRYACRGHGHVISLHLEVNLFVFSYGKPSSFAICPSYVMDFQWLLI